MKGKKRALKGKTEEGDKNHVLKDALEEDGKEHALKDEVEEEDDDDDKKKVLKDETQGEVLEHHDHPKGKALEQKRSPCIRCFQRMKKYPNHVCVIVSGALRCEYCRSVKTVCQKVSD